MSEKRAKQINLKEFEFVVEFDKSDIAKMQTIASRIVYSILSKEFDYWDPEKISAVIEKFLAFLERDVLGGAGKENILLDRDDANNNPEAQEPEQEPEDIITTQASFVIIQDMAMQIVLGLNETIGSFMDWVFKQQGQEKSSATKDINKLQILTTADLPLDPDSFDFQIEDYRIWVNQYALCQLGNNVWAIYPWVL